VAGGNPLNPEICAQNLGSIVKPFSIVIDASVSSGLSAAVWTPASGKRFRVMSVDASVVVDAVCAATEGTVSLVDNVAGNIFWTLGATIISAPAGTVVRNGGPSLVGTYGYLSLAANNVVKLLFTGPATGKVTVAGNLMGREE